MPVRPDGGPPTTRLTHVDENGKAHMVDVTGKAATRRIAEARCVLRTKADVAGTLTRGPAGADPVEEARFTGILAAKQTATLIPLCHPIRIDGIDVAIEVVDGGVRVLAVAAVTDRTGVEMEALTACTVAALALFQPLSAVDPGTSIEELTLWHKSGGRSGVWQRAGDGSAGGSGGR